MDSPAPPVSTATKLALQLIPLGMLALGLVLLEVYADRVAWPVADSWYRLDTEDGIIQFTCQQFAPIQITELPAPGVTRILVVGGSTTFGFPERPDSGPALTRAAHGMVGAMQATLDAEWPGQFELVNLGVNGGSSEDSLRLLRHATDWGASGLLIYDGHNEFMTAPQGFATRLWRFALVRRLYLVVPRAQRSPGWVGPAAYGGPDEAQAVLSQFGHNLESMISVARGAGMTTVLSTQASNLAGFDPSWSVSGDPSQNPGDLSDAELDRAWQAAPDSADLAWVLGQRRLGDPARPVAEARTAFLSARDHDAMPFRAPSTINALIRGAAQTHGLVLVEAEDALDPLSEVPDNRLFYDWVHPRPAAAQALAAAMLKSLAQAGLLPAAPSRAESLQPSDDQRIESDLRTSRSWLQWAFVRAHDPGWRLAQARRYAEGVLELRPDNMQAMGILGVIDAALPGNPTPHPLPTDPELRSRLGKLHPDIAVLLDVG